MDAIRLKSSCICGNTLPYLECCGPFAQPPEASLEPERREWAEFRHAFHELYMYLFPLRNLYQSYWEKLSRENYPHHLLMADPEYGRAVMANFFWDYSVQFSDARPILRAARDVEARDLRLSNDFRQWSLSPLWPGFVLESDERHAYVRPLGADKPRRVLHGGNLPEPGAYVAVRLLPFRGGEYVHPSVLVFPGGKFSDTAVEAAFRGVRKSLGLRSGAGLRPDVQCDEWRRHGASILAMWREQVYDAVAGVPARTATVAPAFSLPVADAEGAARHLASSGAAVLGVGRFEVRYRALPLARLEMRGETVQGVLMDESFRPYVLRWLADHLGADPAPPEEAASEAALADFSGGVDAWLRSPLAILNGETPLRARQHDFGRRRLLALLGEFAREGREVETLRRRLDL